MLPENHGDVRDDRNEGPGRVLISSSAMACMLATTPYWWFLSNVLGEYQSADLVEGWATFIATYRCIRIFNSWMEAYSYSQRTTGMYEMSGHPFVVRLGVRWLLLRAGGSAPSHTGRVLGVPPSASSIL